MRVKGSDVYNVYDLLGLNSLTGPDAERYCDGLISGCPERTTLDILTTVVHRLTAYR